ALALVLARMPEVGSLQRVRARGVRDLHGTRIRGLEGRPQRLVTAHDLVEAALERAVVELALEPEGEVDVGARAPGLGLVEEPEPLLRVRQAHGSRARSLRDAVARRPGAALAQRALEQRLLRGRERELPLRGCAHRTISSAWGWARNPKGCLLSVSPAM